jgi:putative transport protein
MFPVARSFKYYFMSNWFTDLFTTNSIAQTVLVFGLVVSVGIWLGRLKLGGISLGVTWVLFMGMFLSYMGITVDEKTEHFLKEFGLILFVYSIGLQVGPGFFASPYCFAGRNHYHHFILYQPESYHCNGGYYEWCRYQYPGIGCCTGSCE